MLFKTDENVPLPIVTMLLQAGHDVRSTAEQGLNGVTDSALIAVCLVEQRALITLDSDFMNIRGYPPEKYAGIIVLRPHRQSVPSLMHLTNRVLPLLLTEPVVGKLWVVDESQVRIRPMD